MITQEELESAKDNAYWERNQLVAALSKIFPAYLSKHDETDKEWDKDWRTIVYILIPASMAELPMTSDNISYETIVIEHMNGTANGETKDKTYLQLSWHIHDREISMFDHLRYYGNKFMPMWDGHTTEEKYRRLRRLKPQNKA